MGKKIKIFIMIILLFSIGVVSLLCTNYALGTMKEENIGVDIFDENTEKIESDIAKAMVEMEENSDKVFDTILENFKSVNISTQDSDEIKEKKNRKIKLLEEYENLLKFFKETTDNIKKDRKMKDENKEKIDKETKEKIKSDFEKIIDEIYKLGLDDLTQSEETLVWLSGLYEKASQSIIHYSSIENRTAEEETEYQNLLKDFEEIQKLQKTVEERQIQGNENFADIWMQIEKINILL